MLSDKPVELGSCVHHDTHTLYSVVNNFASYTVEKCYTFPPEHLWCVRQRYEWCPRPTTTASYAWVVSIYSTTKQKKMCLYDKSYMDHVLYSCPCPLSCSLFIEDVPVWQALHGSCLIFMSMSFQLFFVYRRCACMTNLTWIMSYIHVHVLSVVLCL